jgi:hypothetical protein
MSWCRAILILVILIVSFGATSALAVYEFIFMGSEGVVWDGNQVYVSSQPWWIGLPSVLAWSALFLWLLLEMPRCTPVGDFTQAPR